MKIRAQMGMVMELDKCIGCHTCLGHLQEGVDQPPGRRVHVVQQRRDQARHRLSEGLGEPGRWNGGWELTRNGRLRLKAGGRVRSC